MENIRKYIRLAAFISCVAIVAGGCKMFGLDYQDSFDYDYEAGLYSNETNMTAWEFINSRTDLFSLMLEGIEYAGMEDYYKESEATYILLINAAFNSTTASDSAYFSKHTLPDPADPLLEIVPESLTQYSVEQIRELLLYHIVKGAWSWGNLPAEPTWYDTFAAADTAKMSIYLKKQRNPNIFFNDYEGHYRSATTARTTNLLTSNNSYMHVLAYWMRRPTIDQLKNN